MDEKMNEKIKEALGNRQKGEADLILKSLFDDDYRKNLIDNPKAVLGKQYGKEIPEGIKVNIIEEKPGEITIVLPAKPAKTTSSEELSDEALENVAGGGNIGVVAASFGNTTQIVVITTIF